CPPPLEISRAEPQAGSHSASCPLRGLLQIGWTITIEPQRIAEARSERDGARPLGLEDLAPRPVEPVIGVAIRPGEGHEAVVPLHGPNDLFEDLPSRGKRLGSGMEARPREQRRQIHEPVSATEANPQVVVHAVAEADVEPSDFFERGPPDEGRRLAD